jgi:hypothetical protein
MSAVDSEQERKIEEAAEAEVAVETTAATPESPASFSDAGPLPPVLEAPIEHAAVAPGTASALAYEPAGRSAEHMPVHHRAGVHHWQEYKAECDASGHGEQWHDKYRVGHTEASGWKQPYERRKAHDWELKRSTSASTALRAWLAGPTVADYRALSVALDLVKLCDELGDFKFDTLFGSDDNARDFRVPRSQRLHISAQMFEHPQQFDRLREIARDHDESPHLRAEENQVAEVTSDPDTSDSDTVAADADVDAAMLGDVADVTDQNSVV